MRETVLVDQVFGAALHKVEVEARSLDGLLQRHLDGLLLRHLGLGTLLVEGGTRGLGRGGGSRGGLVLVGLEEGHGWLCVVLA